MDAFQSKIYYRRFLIFHTPGEALVKVSRPNSLVLVMITFVGALEGFREGIGYLYSLVHGEIQRKEIATVVK